MVPKQIIRHSFLSLSLLSFAGCSSDKKEEPTQEVKAAEPAAAPAPAPEPVPKIVELVEGVKMPPKTEKRAETAGPAIGGVAAKLLWMQTSLSSEEAGEFFLESLGAEFAEVIPKQWWHHENGRLFVRVYTAEDQLPPDVEPASEGFTLLLVQITPEA